MRRKFRGLPSELRPLPWLLEIIGLTAFAVAQPILDVFGRSPETFIFRGADRPEVILFAAVVVAGPALAIWLAALTTLVLPPMASRLFRLGLVWVAGSVVAVQVVKRTTTLLGWRLAVAGLILGAIGALLLTGLRFGRWWLAHAWVAAVAFVLAFLLISPTSKLVLPSDAVAAAVRGEAKPIPVVMVVFDEFPLLSLLDQRGEIQHQLYPNFAALARTSTWYRNFTVTDPSTFYSIPTLLSGQLGRDRERKALSRDYPNTLFTLLAKSHSAFSFETITRLCPVSVCRERAGSPPVHPARSVWSLLGDAVDVWTDISGPAAITRDVTAQFATTGAALGGTADDRDGRRRRSDEPADRFDAFLSTLDRKEGKPGLFYNHVVLPHTPWRFFPSGTSYRRLGGLRDLPVVKEEGSPARWSDESWPVALTRQRHLLQVGYVDALIGRLLDRLDRTGLAEEALVIVTADHGLGLRPGRLWREADRANQHEVLWVPMFVKYPGQRTGIVDDGNYMAPDLLPTIADVMGIDIPWMVDGNDMRDPRGGSGRTKTLLGHRPRTLSATEIDQALHLLRAEAFTPEATGQEASLWPYLVGPGAALVGREVAAFDAGSPWDQPATLSLPRAPGHLAAVKPSSGRLPALVWGTLPADAGDDRTLIAVALNGRIAGVSPLFTKDKDGETFAVLMPESFFQPGTNRLELFEVEGRTLSPIAVRYARSS